MHSKENFFFNLINKVIEFFNLDFKMPLFNTIKILGAFYLFVLFFN